MSADETSGPSDTAGKWRATPTWQIIALLIVFFPAGLYLIWKQDRWSKHTKKITTWTSLGVLAVSLVLILIFAPPTVTVTSSLDPVKSDAYTLTGTISPTGSEVTVNGQRATVDGASFTSNVQLKEGDNNLVVVIVSAGKRTEKVFKIHRFTQAEVTAQDQAAAQANDKFDAAVKDAVDDVKKSDDAAAQQAQKQATDAKAKAPAPTPAATPAPTVSVSQKNALSKAKSYISYTAFSHDGLVDQLIYEQFSAADATYGADNVGANWNEQAAKKAQSYMSYSSFSRGSLIDQLEYEKFTPDQAAYGATAVGL